MKRLAITGLGLLCAVAGAEEAGFPAIRVGDAWVYSGLQKDKRLRRKPLDFMVVIEEENDAGRLVPVHRDPQIHTDRQIGQVLDPVPSGTCVADLLSGIEILTVRQCASPPRVGTRWTRALPEARGRRIQFDIKYAGRKHVKVSAGRFLAHRFEVYQHETTPTTETRVRRVYWYAPEVRGIVIMESQPVDLLGRAGFPRLRAELASFSQTTMAEETP